MKIYKQVLFLSVLSTIFSISGCSNTKKDMVKSGYPASYADGFDDGCHSGKQAAGSLFDKFKKDVNRFSTDSKYAQGWSDAFRQCESKQQAVARQTRMGIEMQNYLAQQKHYKWQRRQHFNRDIMKGIDTSNFKYLK